MMRKFLAAAMAAMCMVVIPAFAQDEGPGLEGVTGDPGSYWGQTVTFDGVLVEYVNSYSFVLGEGAAIDDDRVLVILDAYHPLPLTLVRGERVRVTGVVLPGIDARDNDPNASPFIDDVLNDATRMTGDTMSMTDPATDTSGMTDASADTNVDASGGTGDTTTTTIVGTAMPETPLAPTPEGEGVADVTEEATMESTVATPMPEMEPTVDTSNMGDTTDMILPGMMWEDALAFYWNGNLPDDYNGYTIVRLADILNVEWIPAEVQ